MSLCGTDEQRTTEDRATQPLKRTAEFRNWLLAIRNRIYLYFKMSNQTVCRLHNFRQAIWGHIWKRIAEISQTNAANVTLNHLRQAIWGHIWKRTVEISQTNATNVTLPALLQALYGDIWKHSVEKSQTNATMWLCILCGKQFEEAFGIAQWRKAKQM